MSKEAGWKPDPYRRFDSRYHNGEAWTEHVTVDGVQSTDPLVDQGPGEGLSLPPGARGTGAEAWPSSTAWPATPTVKRPSHHNGAPTSVAALGDAQWQEERAMRLEERRLRLEETKLRLADREARLRKEEEKAATARRWNIAKLVILATLFGGSALAVGLGELFGALFGAP